MRMSSDAALIFVLLASPLAAVAAQPPQPAPSSGTDWGGGYIRGGDSASVTVATSGAGSSKPAPSVVAAPTPNAPLTDWGGGYLRGGDSASTTPATSGAGPAKPNS